MSLKGDRITDYRSESSSMTAEELVLKLRSSFFPLEFQYVAKTLNDREERLKQTNLELKTKAEEEKGVLVMENVKLKDEIDAIKKVNDENEVKFRVLKCELEKIQSDFGVMRKVSGEDKEKIRVLDDQLKMKQNEIDATKKVNGEYEEKFRGLNDELQKQQNEIDAMKKVIVEYENKFKVYEKRPLEFDALAFSSEKIAKKSLIASRNEQNDSADPKLHEIILIDDDDVVDADRELTYSTNKRRRVSDETKTELMYTSRLFNKCGYKSDSFFPNLRSQEQRPDD
ncbi:hypothetical protein Hanom_Chr17g01527531 [Helianthus anomalus]